MRRRPHPDLQPPRRVLAGTERRPVRERWRSLVESRWIARTGTALLWLLAGVLLVDAAMRLGGLIAAELVAALLLAAAGGLRPLGAILWGGLAAHPMRDWFRG